jgi:hypothetical protein
MTDLGYEKRCPAWLAGNASFPKLCADPLKPNAAQWPTAFDLRGWTWFQKAILDV